MAWLWWNVAFMVVAVVVGIGPLVWAMVLDDREVQFEREVLRDIDRLPGVDDRDRVPPGSVCG